MADYFTYAQFSSCTTLIDFQTSNKMSLAWDLPINTNNYTYDRIEIYRYMGTLLNCVNPNTITEAAPSRLIYAAQQDSDGSTITIEKYFPYTVSTKISGTLENMEKVFIDDFSILNSNGYELDIFHSFPGIFNNQAIINDIGHTRRVVYYILKTYIKGISDSAPYLLTPSYSDRQFINHSSKTQVRHNYLQYEGDEIWASFVADAAPSIANGGLSRTAVDINRLYLEEAHAGPTGRGGSAWVSDRASGNVMQYDLKDGCLHRTYKTGIASRGSGIGIHTETGNCLAGPGISPPSLFYCDVNKTTPDFIMQCPGKYWNYGIVPLYGYPDRMYITEWSTQGPGSIFVFGDTLSNSRLIEADDTINGYAAGACPNGHAVQAGLGWLGCGFVHPETAHVINKSLSLPGMTTASTRIGVDNYSLYPNTIINETPDRDYFCLRCRNEYNVHVPFNAVDGNDITINWAIPMIADGGGQTETPGYDGENNLWKVDANQKTKVYRTAGDWFADDGIDESNIYPYGGNSRYPSTKVSAWPLSFTNTKEIEWFLTRNHGVSTYRHDVSIYSLKKIDPTTLDDTTPINWDPARPALSETAYDAWWNMVEQKMVRVSIAKNDNGAWKSAPYFRVYRSDGIQEVNGRKWGIRMNVADIWAIDGRGSNLDDFYENYPDAWEDIIVARIKSWANAFADTDLSYIGNANRDVLIQGNMRGLLVHPFYQYAVSYPIATRYINPSLSPETQNDILYYMGKLKYYEFGSQLIASLYMYSDFTGNILAGTIESTPLSIDKIHPETADPSVVLLLSGYQSNAGYQDTPAYCYPWKNTNPISMSAACTSISGYDDFNVTFIVSAYAGSYTVSSISLSTNDYMPSFLSDENNEAIITETTIQDNVAFLNYTYHTPSLAYGVTHLPSGANNDFPVYSKPLGSFIPQVNIRAVNVYDYSVNGCSIFSMPASATVVVFERWPEPKFFVETRDDIAIRQNLFCNNDWGYERYDKLESVYRESNAIDAKRYDILYGVDPLSATIKDRSISRTWPITSWNIEISTNNFRLSWYPTMTCTVTAAPDYWNGQDVQSFFTILTGMLWRYGDYSISMIVTAGAADVFTNTTLTSTITTTIFDSRNPCTAYLHEGTITFTRGVSTSIYTDITTYGSWVSTGSACYAPVITQVLSTALCPTGYTGTMTISAPVSTTYFSFYSLTGSWMTSTSASCVLNTTPPPDPETDPQSMGPILMNNNNGTSASPLGVLGNYGFYTYKDYDNTPLSLNPTASWSSYSRYYSITGSGLPFGYDYLNGLVIEAIYLDSTSDIDHLPVAYGSYPCPSKIDTHQCNRAYFEVWGCNSTADQTITLYLCSAKDLYYPINHEIENPHTQITWLRLTKDANTFYSGCPAGYITTFPWGTTTTTTTPGP